MVTLLIVMASVAQSKSKPTKAAPTSKPAGTSSVAMKSSLDSFSYAIGMSVGRFYKQQGLTSIKTNLMLKGMGDAMNASAKPMMDDMQCNGCSNYITGLKSEKASAARMKGQRFLDSVGKLPGVVKLPSGLEYKVIKAGTDTAHPKVTDTVKFHYRGTLADGTEFDNSYLKGEPLTHPVSQLVAGMTEALLLMTPGSKWVLFIPSNLGYGDPGAGDVIPPGALIVFELELLEIVKTK